MIANVWIEFLSPTDQQADWVLPATGPPREAGERQEEVGQETTVHAFGVFGTLLQYKHIYFLAIKCQRAFVSVLFVVKCVCTFGKPQINNLSR